MGDTKHTTIIDHILIGKFDSRVPFLIANANKYNTSVGNCKLREDKRPHLIIKFSNSVKRNLTIEYRYYIDLVLIPVEKREEIGL